MLEHPGHLAVLRVLGDSRRAQHSAARRAVAVQSLQRPRQRLGERPLVDDLLALGDAVEPAGGRQRRAPRLACVAFLRAALRSALAPRDACDPAASRAGGRHRFGLAEPCDRLPALVNPQPVGGVGERRQLAPARGCEVVALLAVDLVEFVDDEPAKFVALLGRELLEAIEQFLDSRIHGERPPSGWWRQVHRKVSRAASIAGERAQNQSTSV